MDSLNDAIANSKADYVEVLRAFIERLTDEVTKTELRSAKAVDNRMALLKAVIDGVNETIKDRQMTKGEICWSIAGACVSIMSQLHNTEEATSELSYRSLLVAATLLVTTTVDLDLFPNLRNL